MRQLVIKVLNSLGSVLIAFWRQGCNWRVLQDWDKNWLEINMLTLDVCTVNCDYWQQ